MASNAPAAAKALKGGIPVLFPQFAKLGPLPNHGFARDLPWALADDATGGGTRRARFQLVAESGWGPRWPHPFTLELAVAVGGPTLAVTFEVHNTGPRTWYFTGGLHTYLRLADIDGARLEGLSGRRFLDKTHDNIETVGEVDPVRITAEMDRVYLGSSGPCVLREPGRTITIESAGFPDTVVWNPWTTEARFPDFAPGDYRHMLCVEAAVIGAPATLGPDGRWTGTQTLTWSGT